jgi:hypothetical protein
MSSANREQMTEILTALKVGSVLTKRKHDGEKYSRHYFLHEQENFVSYRQSEKTFTQPTRCK